jgi:hypothetical protein
VKEEVPILESPVSGEIAKLIRVNGFWVLQTTDGEHLVLKLPVDMDRNSLNFASQHEYIPALVHLIELAAEDMAGVRSKRRAA